MRTQQVVNRREARTEGKKQHIVPPQLVTSQAFTLLSLSLHAALLMPGRRQGEGKGKEGERDGGRMQAGKKKKEERKKKHKDTRLAYGLVQDQFVLSCQHLWSLTLH